MISKATKRKGQLGTGGRRSAFKRCVFYVWTKASAVRLQNLIGEAPADVAAEMVLTSERSKKVQKPLYHLILSWHQQEQPTNDKVFAAVHRFLEILGLAERQIVIAIHDDRDHRHAHIVINLVHPITGAVWSKSHDYRKMEAACRQVEVEQGWSHDRGRFDFEVIEKGGVKQVQLRPDLERWEGKKAARAEGFRSKTSAQVEQEKRTGIPVFEHDIPPNLRLAFAVAVDRAKTWAQVHASLATHGLTYAKFGSGARVHLKESTEFAKASSFGARFSIAAMEKRLGPYQGAPDEAPAPEAVPQTPCSIDAVFSEAGKHAASASVFKLTLLRRTYTDLYLDPAVVKAIRRVALDDKPPRVTFKDGTTVLDLGDKLASTANTAVSRAVMIAIAKAKGWSGIVPKGPPEFIRAITLEAAQAGLRVSGIPADLKAEADLIYASVKAQETVDQVKKRVEQLAHLVRSADREQAVAENAAEKRKIADAKRNPCSAGKEQIATAEERGRPDLAAAVQPRTKKPLQKLSDARKVKNPQPSADKATIDVREVTINEVRHNQIRELDALKQIDISVVAADGGWADVSATHRDSADLAGKRYRIYQRGSDTIKAQLVGDRWLWTSNKSGANGSVIDLWLYDNPGRQLGHARQAMRRLAGLPILSKPAIATTKEPEHDDHTEARHRWEQARAIGRSSNYATVRGIASQTLERFRDQVRVGAFGGVYFAHRNASGDIIGFEQRWEKDGEKNRNRFAKGGRKTVNVLGNASTALRMVVVEGGLDALAIAELEKRDDTIYVSTAGGFGDLGKEAIHQLAKGKEVVSAFDNDEAGEAMHRKFKDLVGEAERLRPDRLVGKSPCKDWLDVLVARKNGGEHVVATSVDRNPVNTETSEPRADESLQLPAPKPTGWEDPGW